MDAIGSSWEEKANDSIGSAVSWVLDTSTAERARQNATKLKSLEVLTLLGPGR
jgi:hypothetical protein